MFKVPNQCPTCQGVLTPSELSCESCDTAVRGTWSPGPFAKLSSDEEAFLILFVRSRGNLSEVERALGVSYPTVRAKLEEVIGALSEEQAPVSSEPVRPVSRRREVLDRVARGELSPADALTELREGTQTENGDE